MISISIQFVLCVSAPVEKDIIYVGSSPCSAQIKKLFAESSPDTWEAKAVKQGLILRESGDRLVVWSTVDPVLENQRKLANFLESASKSLSFGKDSGRVPMSALPGALGQSLADSMPYSLKPLPEGSFAIAPAFHAVARNGGGSQSAISGPGDSEPPLGFELDPERPRNPAGGALGALNNDRYSRSLEVLRGTKKARDAAPTALQLFDRESEMLRSLAKQNLYKLFDQLLESAKLTEDGKKALGAKKFGDLPDSVQRGLGSDLGSKWKMNGFKSAADAERFFSESENISVMPMLRIGIRFQNPDGTSTVGYYNLAAPPKA